MTVRIKEWVKDKTWWIWIEVTDNEVINLILRSLNNLIHVNDNNEVYVDLQLEDWIESTDTLPIWVNVGRVLQADGRPVTWTLISWQTTSWDRVKILYGDDWKIRVDNGTGSWNILQYEIHAGEWISIDTLDYSDMQWPCPNGFHIPTVNEITALKDAMTNLTIDTSNWDCAKTYLKMPFSGRISQIENTILSQGTGGFYRTVTPVGSQSFALTANELAISGTYFSTTSTLARASWASIRAFKNIPVVPTNTWTTLYSWTGDAWIFYNTTDWIISISSDWINWITIADKNIWATVVYNDGDTLDQTNCWTYFQRWNNYGFPWTWPVNTANIQADTTWYWPWNYYYGDVFLYTRTDQPLVVDRSSVRNDNLWWWVTQRTEILQNVINNTWVLSVNGQTWHVTTDTKTFYLSSTSDLTNAQAAYDRWKAWRNPFIVYQDVCYNLSGYSNYTLIFYAAKNTDDIEPGGKFSTEWQLFIRFQTSWDTVTNIIAQNHQHIAYIEPNIDYVTPYTPQYDGSPATKKYVDGKVVIDSTAPASPASWQFWYDTTNSALKLYDGSQRLII